ncbi:penicillin-binding protein 1A [Lacimicrobium alkaliphilum]|uniref:Penicillin-binding protein 1A n=1 Tax=Lacimicrobium alkaliphilum TaxID=1526571 RepID=A0A0U3B0N7_9ALTE|nr:PBP1A family penicillin-binding protein [Lacimicrobium alkaliphilum]ALS99967.1 penicillin-sensitive transpeptidase [Lacimicrobium alkaliphilum]
MKYVKPLALIFFVSALLGAIALAALYFYIRPELPSVAILKDVRLQTPMKVYSQDGQLISQFGVKRRIPLELKNIPEPMLQAFLATEDSRFYDHPGVDIIGVARAFMNLVTTGEKGQGASTITMQLARNFFLSREKAWMRKIKETFIALHIEQLLSKDEILELYLNKIELGHRAFGVGAAAQVYFGKTVDELNLAEIATIAGLPKAPSNLNPISNPAASKERRRVVLARMLDEGYISRADFTQAAELELEAKKHGAEIELHAPYLADMIYAEMIKRYGREEAETGGYQVYATVPSALQQAAQQAVKQNLHDYDERHGYRGPLAQLWEEPLPTPADKDSERQTIAEIPGSEDENTAWSEQQMTAFLTGEPSFPPLEPAIVTQVEEKQIRVFTLLTGYIDIGWDGLAWARPFITDSKQGPEPEQASDILKPGAHIMIRFNEELEQWQLSQFPDASSALVSLEPESGAIRAIVGGYSFYQSQFNRAIQAKRQVGSNIKPFIYSAALEKGYSLASIINDAPINQWDRNSGIAWRPKNSPEVYDGPIRMRVALGRSKNVVSVRLLRSVGLDDIISHLAKFGFNPNELPKDESLALGSASQTPLEVARGIAIIGNGGYAVEPYFIERVDNEFGETLWHANPAIAAPAFSEQQDAPLDLLAISEGKDLTLPPLYAPQVLSRQNAFLTREMMRTAIYGGGSWSKNTYWQGTGWRANNLMSRDDLAGKTGTTNDAKDTWFSGLGGNLVTTTWVGFDDMSRSLGRTSRNQYLINRNPQQFNWMGNAMVGAEDGARVAQPAWIRFMREALEGVPEQYPTIPEDIVTVRIDRTTGKLTQRTDHTSRFEYFIRGTEPTQYVDDSEFVDPFDQGQPVIESEDIF